MFILPSDDPSLHPGKNIEQIQPSTSYGRWLKTKKRAKYIDIWSLPSARLLHSGLKIKAELFGTWLRMQALESFPWVSGFGPVLCVFSLAVSGCHLDCGIQALLSAEWIVLLEAHQPCQWAASIWQFWLSLLRLFWSPKGHGDGQGKLVSRSHERSSRGFDLIKHKRLR